MSSLCRCELAKVRMVSRVKLSVLKVSRSRRWWILGGVASLVVVVVVLVAVNSLRRRLTLVPIRRTTAG